MGKIVEQLNVLRTKEEVAHLQQLLQDKQYIALDSETTGIDKDSQIIGISVAADVDTGYYIILSYWDTAQQKLVDLPTKEVIRPFLESLKNHSLILHNAVFDCWMIENNYGISLIDSVHTDTLVLAHLLNENRSNGLKELGVSIFGDDARKEQLEMKESVLKNGGQLTKTNYELYKADADLIAKYGAKDALLTIKLFYHLVPELYEQKLDKFFYEDESMPLLRGPTYELNTTGLRVDPEKLKKLKFELEAECMDLKAFIHKEIEPFIKDEYPGTSKAKTFNIGSSKQLSWLLFEKLGNQFNTLTQEGKEVCKSLDMKLPYSYAAKRQFIQRCRDMYGMAYSHTDKGKPKKIGNYWNYLACGKETLGKLADKYKWVAKFLEYSKSMKLLNTYVEGIEARMKYGVIRPSFLQIGTTSGRYSSKNPNFQNLPKNDKRIKSCIISRPGKVFIGADYSQLEPRIFASISGDDRLIECFEKGEDFYSVVGSPIFGVKDCSMFKDDANSFANRHPKLRDISKQFALATPYGTSAFQQSTKLNLPQERCQEIIDSYFAAYPKVELMMLESHEQAKANGVVRNLFGRPRRIPEAKNIKSKYGNTEHGELPYAARTLLNLSMNHRIQSTGASIMNRAAIAIYNAIKEKSKYNSLWAEVRIVLQVHDSLVLESPKDIVKEVATLAQFHLENSITLPRVKLEAIPKIGDNLSEV